MNSQLTGASPRTTRLTMARLTWASLFAILLLATSSPNGVNAQDLNDSFEGGDRRAFEVFLEGADSVFSDDERQVFSQGMLALVLHRYAPTRDLDPFSRLALVGAAFDRAGETMVGLSYREIFEYGELLSESSRQPGSRTSTGDERSSEDIESALRECIAERVKIALIDIEGPQLFGYKSELSIEIENNLGKAIRGVTIAFTWSTEGRSIPWVRAEESIFVSGGVEPGEVSRGVGFVHLHRIDERPEPFVFEVELIDLISGDYGRFMRQEGWGQCE